MKLIIGLAFTLSSIANMAQPAAEAALEKDDKTLNQRYAVMKDKSQTFNDYKVIKEYILDGMWKLTNDSIQAINQKLATTREDVAQLRQQLNTALATIKHKEESMEDVEFASTHISVLGMDFSKGFFIGMVAVILGGLIVLIILMVGRLRMMYISLKEKVDAEDLVSREFEEYKRKALDRQMKLSRELQDERNKMEELRSA